MAQQVSVPGGVVGNTPVGEAPGYVTVSPIWTSPSTYIAISSYILPVLALVFHRDFSAQAKVLVDAAPGVATVVLLIMRQLHRTAVIKANVRLAEIQQQAATSVVRAQNEELTKQVSELYARVMPRVSTSPGVSFSTPGR